MPYIGNITSDFSIDTGNITNRAVTATKLSPSSVGSNGQVLGVDGSGNLQWTSDPAGQWITNGSDIYFDGGNVGIGTGSSPSDNLHIAESGATNSYIRFSNSNISNGWSVGAQNGGRFQIVQNGIADRFIIKTDGKVGIGTTSPNSILDIRENKDGAETQIRLFNIDNGDTTTQTTAFYMSPDSRGTALTGLRSIKENADFSTNAGRDVSLTLNTLKNNSQTEAIRILSDGKVGIGTTSPSNELVISKAGSAANCKLEIAQSGGGGGTSEILFSDATSGRGRIFFDHGSNPEALNLEAAGTIGLSVTTAGKVGIGTTSPSQELTVYGSDPVISVQEASVSSQVDIGTGTSTGFINIQKADGTRTIQLNGSSDSYLTSGNIGIGTTSPSCKLQIDAGSGGDGTVTFLELNHGGNSTNDAVKLNFARAGGDIGSIVLEKVNNNNTTDFIFNTRASNTVSESMRIKGAGNVGLGTTSPNVSGFNTDARVLTISGPKRGIIELRGNTQAADTIGSIRFFSGNNNEAEITSVADGSYNGDLRFTTNGSERFRIPASTWGLLVTNLGSTGSTGGYQTEGVSLRYSGDSTFVRTDGPPLTITRKGNAGKVLDFYNGTTYAGGIYVDGATSTALQQGSDYRLKENITSISDGITKIKQLNPIYYTNKQIGGINDTTTIKNGFLAHEVQSVIPTLVTGEKDAFIDDQGKGYQTLDYAGFTPTLVAALKEAIAKIETLETKVAALEAGS